MLEVHVTPRAKKERWVKSGLGGVRFYTAAPPVDGKANAALIKAVAERLRMPRSKVELVKGMTSRLKVLRIDAEISEATVIALLAG